jgi:hypothetical protein
VLIKPKTKQVFSCNLCSFSFQLAKLRKVESKTKELVPFFAETEKIGRQRQQSSCKKQATRAPSDEKNERNAKRLGYKKQHRHTIKIEDRSPHETCPLIYSPVNHPPTPGIR